MIKDLLGHAQIHITADVYAHVRPRLQRDPSKPWATPWTPATTTTHPSPPDRGHPSPVDALASAGLAGLRCR
jgi:hypothetical protein